MRQAGRLPDEAPNHTPEFIGQQFTILHRKRRPLQQRRRRPVVFWQELQKLLPGRLGEFVYADGLRLPGRVPKQIERIHVVIHELRLAPGSVNLEALAIIQPSAGGLVHRPGERHAVARFVRDDADLFVINSRTADGNRHLHIQMPLCDHPRQHFQPVLGARIGRSQIHGAEPGRNLLAQIVTLGKRLLFLGTQRQADDQPHPPVVGYQGLNAARRQRQRIGGKISRQAVVLNGASQRRVVKQFDQVAVFVAVPDAPFAFPQ